MRLGTKFECDLGVMPHVVEALLNHATRSSGRTCQTDLLDHADRIPEAP